LQPQTRLDDLSADTAGRSKLSSKTERRQFGDDIGSPAGNGHPETEYSIVSTFAPPFWRRRAGSYQFLIMANRTQSIARALP